MSLIRSKARARIVAIAFAIASVVGVGAFSIEPAGANTITCGWNIQTVWNQGGVRVVAPNTSAVKIRGHLRASNGTVYYIDTTLAGAIFWQDYFFGWWYGWGTQIYIPGAEPQCTVPIA